MYEIISSSFQGRTRRGRRPPKCKFDLERMEERTLLSDVHALFNLDLAHPTHAAALTESPFPSNLFTKPDDTQNTGLVVNLPLPDPATNPSDYQDTQVINTLDGFNLQPRLSIPFDGPIDVKSVISGPIDGNSVANHDVFLVRLGDTLPGGNPGSEVVGINQVVWDPATTTLYVESDQLLDQHTRYALIVTDGVQNATGRPVQASDDFKSFRHDLNFGQTKDPSLVEYRTDLLDAMAAAAQVGAPVGHIVTASVFTTQSVTAELEKIRDQIHAGLPQAPATADFNVGLNGEHTVFSQNELTSIVVKQQQTVGAAPVLTAFNPLAQLRVIPGEANVVGQVAYGKYLSPDYEVHPDGYIPAVGTRTGTPEVQGYNDIYFTLYLPVGARPAGGWPVAILGHGGSGNKDGTYGVAAVAAKMAENGIATIGINAVGDGYGPGGRLTVTKTSGDTVILPAGGRGIDQNGDGKIGATEGESATSPRAIISSRDARIQTAADHTQLVRVIEGGMDVDGDGAADLDPSRVYYIGASLSSTHGALFLAVEPDVSAGILNTVGGPVSELRRLRATSLASGTEGGRPGLGAELATRVPSLVNASGITKIGGLTLSAPYFNENMPLWDDNPQQPDANDDPLTVDLADGTRNVVIQSPVTNTVAGAMELQQLFENQEWVFQSGSPIAYAPYLRKDPLPGVPAKSVLVQFAKGDQSIPNPTTAAFLRAGELSDVATFYRHDLAYADNPARPTNPHPFISMITTASMRDISFAVQQQIATFFAWNGSKIIPPQGFEQYFEVGMKESQLPEGLNYISTGAAAVAPAQTSGSLASGPILTDAASDTLNGEPLVWSLTATSLPAGSPLLPAAMITSGSTSAARAVPQAARAIPVPLADPSAMPIAPVIDLALDDLTVGPLRPARRRL